MNNQTICVDIDNTICTESKDYTRCLPKEGAIVGMRRLKQHNNFIVLHTARHIDSAQLTMEWLRCNEIVYDYIQFGKPPALIYIDDKGYKFETWGKLTKDLYNDRDRLVCENILDIYERVLEETYVLNKTELSDRYQLKRAMKKARKAVNQ